MTGTCERCGDWHDELNEFGLCPPCETAEFEANPAFWGGPAWSVEPDDEDEEGQR